MKAIIYAGIGLFSAATVYGVVDYYGTKKTGTLDKMYKEEETVVPAKEETMSTVELPVKNEPVKATVVKTKAATTKASKTKRTFPFKTKVREVKFSDFSRGRIIPKKVAEDTKILKPVIEEENK
jgi:hypothetical protein